MAPLAPVTARITLLPRDDSEGGIKGMLVSVFREVKKVRACVPASFGVRSLLETLVIPAKAGIYSANPRKQALSALDSRFRGNDCDSQLPGVGNDTSTCSP
jgi:hypothetical protein